MDKNTPPKKRSDRKLIGIWFLIMALFIVELFFYTWCRVQCIRVGYELADASEKHQKLLTLQKKLSIEIASLKSPERIKKIAEEQLGLTMPHPDQMINIR